MSSFFFMSLSARDMTLAWSLRHAQRFSVITVASHINNVPVGSLADSKNDCRYSSLCVDRSIEALGSSSVELLGCEYETPATVRSQHSLFSIRFPSNRTARERDRWLPVYLSECSQDSIGLEAVAGNTGLNSLPYSQTRTR